MNSCRLYEYQPQFDLVNDAHCEQVLSVGIGGMNASERVLLISPHLRLTGAHEQRAPGAVLEEAN